MRRFSQKCSLVALDQDDGIPGADGKTGVKPGRTGVGSGERKVAFIDEYVRTAVDEGTVIVKTGWEYLAEEVEEEKPIYEAMLDESVIPEY